MADWNNETDSIVHECKLGTLRSKWNKGGEQREGNQYNNLQNWVGGKGGSESGTSNHCDVSIVEHSVAT